MKKYQSNFSNNENNAYLHTTNYLKIKSNTVGIDFKQFKCLITGVNLLSEDKMQTDDTLNWVCQYCGVENSVWIDLTVNGKQDFIEDCRICCRPNRIIVTTDYDENVMIESRFIDE